MTELADPRVYALNRLFEVAAELVIRHTCQCRQGRPICWHCQLRRAVQQVQDLPLEDEAAE